MRTWQNFKEKTKEKNNYVKDEIDEMETLALIINAIIDKRNELGYSQRDLAKVCGLPHSSVARIESCVVKPNVETLLKIMHPLGLTLSVSSLS